VDKNKRYVFFIRAESHVKGMKMSLKKNRFFSFRVNIVETMRERKNILNKSESFQEYLIIIKKFF